MRLIDKLIAWIKSLTQPKCQHIWEARFRFEGEWGIAYEKCVICGEELNP